MDFQFDTSIWLAIWYIFVAAVIFGFIGFFRYINMPKWRDSHGDRTSEAGYFEDSVGHIIVEPLGEGVIHESGELIDAPHIQPSATMHNGPI